MNVFLLLWAVIASILAAGVVWWAVILGKRARGFEELWRREKMKTTELQAAVQAAVAKIAELKQQLADATANTTPDSDVQSAIEQLTTAVNS